MRCDKCGHEYPLGRELARHDDRKARLSGFGKSGRVANHSRHALRECARAPQNNAEGILVDARFVDRRDDRGGVADQELIQTLQEAIRTVGIR